MSAERCPACRSRVTQEPTCPRCACDLTLARRAQAQARRLIFRALSASADGERQAAQSLARAALLLEYSRMAARVLRMLEQA